ncbi:hypothetical protein [Streptomyces sp. NPDC005077]|uniref:LexA family protein n=1 Tax=Streptomyces sp. NPDC005077 TaxID=3154292 RepID=UPI0033A8212A
MPAGGRRADDPGCQRARGWPTVREIGRRVGRSSSESVAYQLGRLEKFGLISRNGRHWRSCRLTG